MDLKAHPNIKRSSQLVILVFFLLSNQKRNLMRKINQQQKIEIPLKFFIKLTFLFQIRRLGLNQAAKKSIKSIAITRSHNYQRSTSLLRICVSNMKRKMCISISCSSGFIDERDYKLRLNWAKLSTYRIALGCN